MILFILDIILSIAFMIGHIYYFTVLSFESQSDHILHILLGAGFTSIILVYSFSDGMRFLRSNFDKILYLISCCMQKPILLPVLFPNRFRSRIAVNHIDTHSFYLKSKVLVNGMI